MPPRPVIIRGALLVGAVMAAGGILLFLNVVSFRQLALETQLHPAIVFHARDAMSHTRAQGLELLTGLVGASVVLVTALWLRKPSSV